MGEDTVHGTLALFNPGEDLGWDGNLVGNAYDQNAALWGYNNSSYAIGSDVGYWGTAGYSMLSGLRCPPGLIPRADDNVPTPDVPLIDPGGPRVPYGFGGVDEFAEFSADLRSGLSQAGYSDVTPILQGSAVTGVRFRTGESISTSGPGDFDVAIASRSLLERAAEVGVGLRSSGTRTGPLRVADLRRLGLLDLRKTLSGGVGRQVNFMIYGTVEDALSRGPSQVLP